MKLTLRRITRYLGLQKKVNNFILKLNTKDRDNLVKLSSLINNAVKLEEELRNMQLYMIAREENKEQKIENK